MKKQKPHKTAARHAAKSGGAQPVSSMPRGEAADLLARETERRGEATKASSGMTAAERFRAGVRTLAFRIAFSIFLAGVLIVTASLTIPHEFAFFELGYLFTLSIYDLVLAMIGLSVAIGVAERRGEVMSIVIAFLGVMTPMLVFFDPIFSAILQSPLGHELFLIAPVAVLLSGLVLWLPAGIRRFATPVSAAIVGFSFALFIGLDDFGIGIQEFTLAAVLGALWILVIPGLMLRPFRGAWLTIPARIIGSWLMAIAVIVTVSLYVPFTPDAPPLPDPSLPDGGETLDAPGLPPLDPAIEEGLIEAPDQFGTPQSDDGALPPPAFGDNPLLGGGRNREP